MPHTVESVPGEAPGAPPPDKLAELEAKLAALTLNEGKLQKVLGRLQSVETRLAALESHHAEPAKMSAREVKKH